MSVTDLLADSVGEPNASADGMPVTECFCELSWLKRALSMLAVYEEEVGTASHGLTLGRPDVGVRRGQ